MEFVSGKVCYLRFCLRDPGEVEREFSQSTHIQLQAIPIALLIRAIKQRLHNKKRHFECYHERDGQEELRQSDQGMLSLPRVNQGRHLF